jgi:hypothetical protein
MDGTAALPDEVRRALVDGESVLAFVWVRLPQLSTGGTTFLIIRLIVEVVDFFGNLLWMRQLRTRAGEHGVPFEGRMAFCVTDERILIWRASSDGRRLRHFLGELREPDSPRPPSSIPHASFGPWRTVAVITPTGSRALLRVNAGAAQAFVDALQTQN